MAQAGQAAPGAGSAAGGARAVALLAAVVAVVQVATMPRFFYPGDNSIARVEARTLLERGSLGVPYDEAGAMRSQARGQYFYENDAKRTMYSKYGFGYTLLYLAPLAVARAIGADQEGTDGFLLVLNLFGALLAVGTALYLYAIAGAVEPRPLARAAFVLLAIYPSFVWTYLRAPALEVFQLFFFAAFCAHALAFLREEATPEAPARSSASLAGATVAAGMLLLMRPTFAILLPLLAAFALASGPRELPLAERVRRNLRGEGARILALGFLAPAAVLVGTWLVVNAVRTGSALDTGYAQWTDATGRPVARFTASAVPAALAGFFFRIGNANLFLHAPLVALGAFGWPALFRRHRREAWFLAATAAACVVPMLAASNWSGEWCYGPRYLVHPALALSVPALLAWRALPRRRAVRRSAAALAAVVLGASLLLQVEVNSAHWFAPQLAVSYAGGEEALERYAGAPRLRGLDVFLLKGFAARGDRFGPIDGALDALPAPARPEAREGVRRRVAGLLRPNWWFAGWLDPERPGIIRGLSSAAAVGSAGRAGAT